jgi:hypothetical protein
MRRGCSFGANEASRFSELRMCRATRAREAVIVARRLNGAALLVS